MQKQIIKLQQNEITEHFVYAKLAAIVEGEKNRKILLKISNDEKRHYEVWKKISGVDIGPRRLQIFYYVMIVRIFGLAFGLRLMERGENLAQRVYSSLKGKKFDEVRRSVLMDEQKHEKYLIGLLDDAKLAYSSSIVLGLNDALVEFTGTIAGLTLAVKTNSSIALVGAILGVAASLSMASSEFLSSKEEGDETRSPLKSALYTGMAYILTVVLLIAPYLIVADVFTALFLMLLTAVVIIFLYTFYISTAKNLKFWHRFGEMVSISAGVALLSFFIGWGIKRLTGIEI